MFSTFMTVALSAAVAASPAGGPATPGLPQLDTAWWPSQLFWLAVTFGVLYWLMAGRFLPALGTVIEERRDRVADDIDKAGELEQSVREVEDGYEKSVRDAKDSARNLALESRAAIDAEVDALRSEADRDIEALAVAARARLLETQKNITVKTRDVAARTAVTIVETLIGCAPAQEQAVRVVAGIRDGSLQEGPGS